MLCYFCGRVPWLNIKNNVLSKPAWPFIIFSKVNHTQNKSCHICASCHNKVKTKLNENSICCKIQSENLPDPNIP
jgi:hypothetical protein